MSAEESKRLASQARAFHSRQARRLETAGKFEEALQHRRYARAIGCVTKDAGKVAEAKRLQRELRDAKARILQILK